MRYAKGAAVAGGDSAEEDAAEKYGGIREFPKRMTAFGTLSQFGDLSHPGNGRGDLKESRKLFAGGPIQAAEGKL